MRRAFVDLEAGLPWHSVQKRLLPLNKPVRRLPTVKAGRELCGGILLLRACYVAPLSWLRRQIVTHSPLTANWGFGIMSSTWFDSSRILDGWLILPTP